MLFISPIQFQVYFLNVSSAKEKSFGLLLYKKKISFTFHRHEVLKKHVYVLYFYDSFNFYQAAFNFKSCDLIFEVYSQS